MPVAWSRRSRLSTRNRGSTKRKDAEDKLHMLANASRPGDVIELAPNIISVKHWDRLLGGLLYAVQPRVDWAALLRRSFAVDVRPSPAHAIRPTTLRGHLSES